MASTCAAAAAAYRESKWFRRVRVGASGAVRERASGTFGVTVALGFDVQAAVDRCPPGGCVLLLPGAHKGPLVLGPREVANGEGPPVHVADKEVHVFGRRQATLRLDRGTLLDRGRLLASLAAAATVDGLTVAREVDIYRQGCVCIAGGRLRLQACDITSEGDGISIERGADPVVAACKYVG